VLDLAAGRPAEGVRITVSARHGELLTPLGEQVTGADGRAHLIPGAEFTAGAYRLAFEVAAYFEASGAAVADPPFLDVVIIDFGVADAAKHHHVPLLISPFGYSTYKGG
jgi:5-hydroxyisourate hydrolase